MKRRKFLTNYINAAATVTVSSGIAAKLVIEELPLYRCFLSLPNTHSLKSTLDFLSKTIKT
jgi:hypothetical protein